MKNPSVNTSKSLSTSYLKIGQAAKALGVSIDTLRRWEKAGKIKAVRTPGGTRLYHISTLKKVNPVFVDDFQAKSLSTEELLNKIQNNSERLSESDDQTFRYSDFSDTQSPSEKKKASFVTKFLLGSAFLLTLTLILTSWIAASYLTKPNEAKQFFKSNIASGLFAPFHFLAQETVAVIDPKKAEELGFKTERSQASLIPPDNPPPIAYKLQPKNSNVLAETASSPYLEVNSDTRINGSLYIRDNINGLSLEATPSGNTFALTSGNTTLTVTKTAKLDQDVSTAASPTFNTLNLSATKNQLVFQSGGPAGSLTWTPSAARTITLPDATGTVVLDSATQTLTNKSMSGSSNTFTNISNSALANSKVTVTAGTNLSGGGDINLGGSATLALKDSISLAGTLTVSGATTLSSTLAVTGATTLSSTLTAGGVVQLADGTAAAPGLTFTNDTNTGLYRIGADKIGLITGGSATSGITIDASGNVGVDTISPSYTLDVTGRVNGSTALCINGDCKTAWSGSSGNTASNGLTLSGVDIQLGGVLTRATGIDISSQNFGFLGNIGIGTSANSGARLSVMGGNVGIGATTANSLLSVSGGAHIGTIWQGISAPTNGLFVDGNVGIGATTSSNKLDVWGNSRLAGTLTVDSTSTFGGNLTLSSGQFLAPNGSASLPSYSFTNLTNAGLWTNGDGLLLTTGGTNSEGITIGGNGNVGIGTTMPLKPFHVLTGTTNFVIDASGRVGINNSAPSAMLDLNLGTTTGLAQAARFRNSKTATVGTGSYISFAENRTTGGITDVAGVGGIITSIDNTNYQGALVFMTANANSPAEVARFDYNGNLGIGITSPLTTLAAAGNMGIGVSYGWYSAPINGLAVQGNVGIGITTANSNLSIAGNAHIGSIYQGIATPTDGLFVDGNVGIGATTSSNKLDVWGNARIAGNLTVDATTTLNGLSSFAGTALCINSSNQVVTCSGSSALTGTGVSGGVTFWNGTSSLSNSVANFYWDSTNNRLGIGTSAPSQEFQVNINTSNPVVITSGGNLGIGTTAPNAKLDINGNVGIGWGYTSSSTFPTNGLAVSGNVGIGTTTASQALDVIGAIALNHSTVLQQNTTLNNLFVGSQAGNIGAPATGIDNTFVGIGVGTTNASGNYNTFMGYQAGNLNKTGSNNSFFGNTSGISNTTGTENSFFGSQSGYYNTTGLNNSFFGYQTGQKNTSGANNSFFGYGAGFSNTTGGNNSFVGFQTGLSNTTGGNNSYLGKSSGYSNSTGSYNVFLGTNAGYYELGSNKLYLSSSATLTARPLIYGDFSAGNVGIGTTAGTGNTPSARLQLEGTGSTTGLTFFTGGLGYPSFGLAVLDNGNVGIGTTGAFASGTKLAVLGGNVGIGITTANSLLSVAGGAHIGGTYQGIAAPANGLFVDGNVGIGATTSSNKLDVWGNSRIAGNLTVDGTLTQNGNISTSGVFLAANGSASAPSYSFTNLTNAGLWTNGNGLLLTTGGSNSSGITVTGAGNIGIGTTSPTYQLQTTGNVGIGGSLTVSSGLSLPNSSITNANLVNSSISVSATAGTGISVSGSPVSLGGTLTVAGIDASTSVKGVASFNSTNFSVTSGSVNTIQDIATASSPSFSALTLSGNNAALSFTGSTPSLTSSSSAFGLFAGGNVGIGTTGNLYGGLTVRGAGTGTNITLQTYGSNLAQGLTVLDNGNVGIGTTNPMTQLTVGTNVGAGLGNAEFGVDGAGNLLVIHAHAGGNMPAGINTYVSRGTTANPSATQANDQLYFMGARGYGTNAYGSSSKAAIIMTASQNWTNANQGTYIIFDTTLNNSTTRATRMIIDNAGNVGIGATLPQATLVIQGNVGIGYTGVNQAIPANGLAVSGNLGIGTTTANSLLSVAGGAHIGSIYQGISAPTDGLFVDGNVGIGATTSSNKLDVWGAARITNGLTLEGLSSAAATALCINSSNQVVQCSGSSALTGTGVNGGVTFWNGTNSLSNSAANFYWDSANNRLGIGTSAPYGTLQVGSGVAPALFVNNGNVGIGTTGPGAYLSVFGSVGIGNTGGGGFALSAVPSNGLAVQGNVGIGTTTANSLLAVAGGAHIGSVRQGTVAPTDGLFVDGNVGIGATTSSNKLDVWGNARIAGNLTVDGTTTYGGNLTLSSGQFLAPDGTSSLPSYSFTNSTGTGMYSPSVNALALNTNGAATPPLTITAGGNIGIGVTNPTSFIGINGSNGQLAIQMERNTTSNTAGNALQIGAGGATVGANNKAGGNLLLYAGTSTGNATSSIIFHVPTPGGSGTTDRTVTPGMTLTGTGGGQLSIAGNNAALTFTGSTPSITSGSSVLGLFAGGNVGIGTTGNLYGALTVKGTSTGANITLQTYGLNLAQGLSALDNGNVGIGTTGPGSALTVIGNVGIGTSAAGASLQSNGGAIFWPSTTALTGPSFGLATNGNIGIGATTANSNLSVAGSAHIGGTYQGIAGPTNGLFVDGNVGIGATTSTNMLDVWGNTRLAGNLTVDSTTTLNGLSSFAGTALCINSSNQVVQCSGSSALTGTGVNGGVTFWNGTSSLSNSVANFYWDSTNNRLGIGTSSPDYNLRVNGTGYFSGFVGIGSSLNVSGNVGIGSSLTTTSAGVFGSLQDNGSLVVNGTSYLQAINATSLTTTGNITSQGVFLAPNGSASAPSYSFTNSTSTGLWSPSTNALSLTTNGSGTSGITITAGGNIGIGITSPLGLFQVGTVPTPGLLVTSAGNVGIGTTSITAGVRLDVTGTIRASGAYQLGGTTVMQQTLSGYTSSVPSGGTGWAYFDQSMSGINKDIRIYGYPTGASANNYASLQIVNANNDFQIKANNGAGSILLIPGSTSGNVGIGTTSPATTLQIGSSLALAGKTLSFSTSTGNLGIGTTQPGAALSVAGNVGIGVSFANSAVPANGLAVAGNVGVGTTTANTALSVNGDITDQNVTGCNDATHALGSDSTGKIVCNASISDARLKQNILSLGGTSALNALSALRPVSFYWKDTNLPGTGTNQQQFGFIAQEVAGVLPNLVETSTPTYLTPDGTYSLNYQGMIPLLTKAVQEQQNQINNLLSRQATASALLSGLNVSPDGALNVPKLNAGQLAISADLNFNTFPLYSLLSSATNNPPPTTSSIDILTSLNSISTAVLGIQTQESTASAQLAALEDKIASQSGVIAGVSQVISTQSSALTDLKTQVASLSAQMTNSSAATATSSATASASTTDTLTNRSTDTLNLTPPSILLATQSAQLVNLTVTSDATVSGQLTSYDLNIQNSLKSVGQTALGNTLIAGDLTVDGTMSLTGNSLSTLGNLSIQNSPLAGPVDFFNGLVTIGSNGSLIAQTVSAPEVIANKLTIATTPIASSSAQLANTSGSSIGSATIPAGQIKVAIVTDALTPKSKVFITPRSSTQSQTPYVELSKPGTGFVVSIDNPISRDIDFDWWVVDTK